MKYVDGFVLPVPKKNLKRYLGLARRCAKIWVEHGALEYREAVAEDTRTEGVLSFPALAGTKTGETVIFSWIGYTSRAHRDRVNARVMADPRIARMMEKKGVPFDPKRMAYGGFKIVVQG